MTHTTNSNFARLCRSLVCLFLVCCLCFNMATMPAKVAVLVDDLVLLGILGAALLLLGGVVFNAPTQDDFRSIGQSFSTALDTAAKTDEQTIIITAVRRDLIEQARQGMNYNKPPRIPMNSFDFWVNAAILAWINSWLNGENAIEQQATDRNGNLIMANGQFVAAGETFNMPVHPNPSFGYANATCCVTNTDCYVYRCFYHTCDEGTGGVCRFYAVLYAPGDVTFQTSRYLCASRQYSSVDQVEVDGQVYSWCLITLETLRGTTNICDGSFGAHELGAVRLEGHTGITDGTIAAALIGGELIPDTTNKTARYPDLLTGGIKDYLDNGGSTQDIVLPDIDLSGIMQNGETLDEAVSGSMSDVANGSETWQEYVDAVTPNGDITTQDGNEITDTGVSENVSLWGLLKRMADYLLNGLSALKNGISSLNNFFTGTTIIQSPLDAIKFDALFDLFPFNIPYGIYQAISFWDADGAAPVITIPLPTVEKSGVGIYEYKINFADIPGMDALVSVIRAGELILFAIGLLMVTRKVTKW